MFFPSLVTKSLRVGTLRKPINLLILGTDITFNAETGKPIPNLEGRADTILLAHIDPINSRINMVSIPRDTLVNIPGYGDRKINSANSYGGIPLMKETVAQLTKQKIDYYISIKPTAVTKMVDQLGGVSLYVENDMRYVDRAQGLDIDLKKGWQKLSGKQAHDYIRYRHDYQGDIGRVNRQQIFLKSFREALTKPTNIFKAPLAIHLALREIKTNLPPAVSVRLLNMARMLSVNSVNTTTLSGEVANIQTAGSVWLPNDKENIKIFEDFF
ncbi:hypothetical protein A3J44_03415 [candidate division WOR-1 bacterium RIFCSPHIGHO2_02_FULL_45_12]|uniref:Cell envelope-related transcriptional attenuator domain-containing protein n=1 Tax=candidate division WOR-1 bacterium RIFCSPLOWO2_12_FULL_45_9 TaxID=1802568 RepID=A0A1F4RLU1_UNCSA|nr:MAG: hypothetical protein A3J44_03415 [candidate division WOR-1 bacterium RIFCSPHIGHO2_02_FULL_45_12]OGC09119.1 MAG: hypothetical protein A3F86_01420 [candidate division WOR-1 bacterium RIFCSPLOWO2_12_FULL_45_9]